MRDKSTCTRLPCKLTDRIDGQDSESTCEILKRGAFLVGRQISCPLPGSGPGNGSPGIELRGPPVTYKPGPPAPLCTQNCGKLCSGFYCIPTPTGTPPDFESPAPKPSTTAGNDNGNGNGATGTNTGNGGNGGNGFPTLTFHTGTTAPPGQSCLSSTTAIECNGGLHGGVCVTSTKCASFGQHPIITSKPAPSQITFLALNVTKPQVKASTQRIACVTGPHSQKTSTPRSLRTTAVPTPRSQRAQAPFRPDSPRQQTWTNVRCARAFP